MLHVIPHSVPARRYSDLLSLDLLVPFAIVRGKPHRVDESGECLEGEPGREDETDPKLRHMLRFWLCTGHVASPAGDWAWWFYYDRWRKYSTHRPDNLCCIHSISHRMNARILLEERPPRRAATLTQEGELDEHAEKELSRDGCGAVC